MRVRGQQDRGQLRHVRVFSVIHLFAHAALIAKAKETNRLKRDQAEVIERVNLEATQERAQFENQVATTLHERYILSHTVVSVSLLSI